MSFFILFLLFTSLIGASLLLHYGLDAIDILPAAKAVNIAGQEHFKIDYTFFMNIAFLIISGVLIYFGFVKGKEVMHHKEMAPKSPALESTLKYLAFIAYAWIAGGLIIHYFYI
jgi:heme/copper-type cytochrome/quinol oxidase subunit 2